MNRVYCAICCTNYFVIMIILLLCFNKTRKNYFYLWSHVHLPWTCPIRVYLQWLLRISRVDWSGATGIPWEGCVSNYLVTYAFCFVFVYFKTFKFPSLILVPWHSYIMSILVYKHLVVLSHFSIEIFVFSISCHHNQIALRPIKIGFWNSVAKNWVLKIKTWNIFWLCFLPVRLPMGLWLWLHVVILLGPRVYPRLPLLLRCLLVLGLSIDSDIPVIKLVCFHLALELDLAVHTFLTGNL
jgi:hypothetical protein